MRVIIKGADFSEVSIGKVIRDLSFRVSANKGLPEGVHGFPNWDESTQVANNVKLYQINEGVVQLPSVGSSARLQSDYIEVSEGMIISADTSLVATSRMAPQVVCFDSNKNLFTDAAVYSAYISSTNYSPLSFTIPAGVKYIKIQSSVGNDTTATHNVYIGSMPE